MNSELTKSIRKLEEISNREEKSHLFEFRESAVQFKVEKTNGNWLWVVTAIFIFSPFLHILYCSITQDITWFMTLIDIGLISYGVWRIKTKFIDNRQTARVNLLEGTILLQNTYPKISRKQEPLLLAFDQIESVDILEITNGPNWWQKHYRLIFENHSKEVLAYIELCASLEIRPIARGIKRFVNTAINQHKK